MFHKHFIMFLC